MKLKLLTPLLCSLTLVACSIESKDENAKNTETATNDTADDRAIDSYLSDAIESAYKDESGEVDDSVMDDLKEERLQKMAEKMMAKLDADSSGSLSEDEYVSAPEKFCGKFSSLPAEVQEKIKAKLKEEFAKNAGDDKLLSVDELKVLLASMAPRVGGHRKGKGHGPGDSSHGGKHGGGDKAPNPSWEEILKKYDKDGDGKLSKEEFEAFLADKKKNLPQKPPMPPMPPKAPGEKPAEGGNSQGTP